MEEFSENNYHPLLSLDFRIINFIEACTEMLRMNESIGGIIESSQCTILFDGLWFVLQGCTNSSGLGCQHNLATSPVANFC